MRAASTARASARRRSPIPQALRRLEELVHPVVAARRRTFLSAARARGARMAAMEIPLLVETGGERFVDVVVLVDAPESVRRERAMARPGMNAQKLAAIVARQAGDSARRRRAHFTVDTGGAMESTRAQAMDLFRALAGSEKEKPGDA
jgi:dephospho-CoA kinase